MGKIVRYGGTAFVLLIAGAVSGDLYVRSLGPRARVRVIQALQDRFNADVELKTLDLRVFPRPSVSGEALVIHRRGQQETHPLVAIAQFSAHARFWDLLFQHDRVSQVRLQGLQIHMPPKGNGTSSGFPSHEQVDQSTNDETTLRIGIGEIIADGAFLEIEPKGPGKDPLQFHLQKLTLWSVGSGEPMSFAAKLTNPKPPGLIETTGTFGPWKKDVPRSSPVAGKYTFQNADLGVFKGIRGTLSSRGTYNGILERIEVNGDTDTPDFALKRGGTPVHLRTTFHAIVDGVDGETLLQPVDARFLNSEFICEGGVIKLNGDTAKTVDLVARTKKARMEDILQLVVGDQRPILTGAVDFQSKIVIPPGHEDVLNKLKLDGRFNLHSAVFTSLKVEQRLRTLSNRARGISKGEEQGEPKQTVASDLTGAFRLNAGVASFSRLSFDVPGAQVKLAGDYNLRSRQIDMAGIFRMQATLADTQSGLKHWLLKPLDPLFDAKGAGFQIPLKIAGQREHPTLSVEVFHHQFTVK